MVLEFFKNTWVVGIGSGIISSIAVYYLTNILVKHRDASKHLEQIQRANLDLIRTLKPYVAEKGLPQKEVVNAVITSTARKYGVSVDEVYTIRTICEELIREIIDNVYVSSDQKQEYTMQLYNYLHEYESYQNKKDLPNHITVPSSGYSEMLRAVNRHKHIENIAMILSLITGLCTSASIYASMLTDITLSFNFESLNKVVAIVAVTFCLLLIFVPSIFSSKRYKKEKKDKFESSTTPTN